MDEIIKIKIEHEISRIDKQIDDVIPLLNLCKIKEQPDIIGFGDSHLFCAFFNLELPHPLPLTLLHGSYTSFLLPRRWH